MPDLEFIKLTTYMFDDEKIRIIESMPDADSLLVIWVKLLCQAGKTYAGGYIWLNENVPYTEEELASVLSRPINTVRLALNTFKRLNMITINDNGIYLKNFPKHQNIEAIEKGRELAKIRQQKHRLLLTQGEAVTRESRNGHNDITPQKKKENKDNRIRNKKKSIYGQFKNVLLTNGEETKLIDRFTKEGFEKRVESLSLGIESKGYKYKSHYAAILNWERMEEQRSGTHKDNTAKGKDDSSKYISGEYGKFVKH